MIGIALATAAAGIVVGTVTVTGLGLVMTDFVETVSAGNIIAMLLLVAFICLVLGMGMPTTASYIVVSTLMAPVVVELGAQSGLVVPLVAVHMFVFYFGLMADVTPPVGLASFAAAAISRADPIRTGATAFWYSSRTAILPFMFIFNPQLLMIGIGNVWQFLIVVVAAIVAMLTFAAGTQGWFLTRNRLYESVLLLLVTFTLLRPGFWLDLALPRYDVVPAQSLAALAAAAPPGAGLRVRIEGTTLEGKDVKKTVLLPLAPEGSAAERIAGAGLRVMALPDRHADHVGRAQQPCRQGRVRAGVHGDRHRDRTRAARQGMAVPAGGGAARGHPRAAAAARSEDRASARRREPRVAPARKRLGAPTARRANGSARQRLGAPTARRANGSACKRLGVQTAQRGPMALARSIARW